MRVTRASVMTAEQTTAKATAANALLTISPSRSRKDSRCGADVARSFSPRSQAWRPAPLQRAQLTLQGEEPQAVAVWRAGELIARRVDDDMLLSPVFKDAGGRVDARTGLKRPEAGRRPPNQPRAPAPPPAQRPQAPRPPP